LDKFNYFLDTSDLAAIEHAKIYVVTDFTAKVKAFMLRHGMLSKDDRVLVAVSGGPDSVALLRVLYDFRDELRLRLEVAHFEHGIRGEEARQDGEFVRDLVTRMGLPFHFKKLDLPQVRADAGKGNLEALARRERYRFFNAVARAHDSDKVALGHTLDDQAETVLMWLLRGSGTKGLGGMAPVRRLKAGDGEVPVDLTLVRPLLGISKAEVIEFLKEKGLGYRLDRTNEDESLLRNWIRLRLIPQLKERIDPRLPFRLSRQAELIRSEHLLLDRLAGEALDKIRQPAGLDRQGFLQQEEAMQRLMLRRWISETRGHLRAVDFEHVEDLLRLIKLEKPQSQFSLPGGWKLVREYESLRLERRSTNVRPCYRYDFEPGVDLNVPEAGMVIRSAWVAPPLVAWPEALTEAVFDGALFSEKPVVVRNFRRGDVFRPLGMAGQKKVKQLFIDKKVPLSVRATLPLLSLGREVLWMPGYGRSETGKVGPQTKEILRFTAVPVRAK
jgi:tRNA(Ile)-lysidine synthase